MTLWRDGEKKEEEQRTGKEREGARGPGETLKKIVKRRLQKEQKKRRKLRK